MGLVPLLAALAVSLAACNSGSKSASPTTVVTAANTTVRPVATTTAVAPSRLAYVAAQSQWKQGASASSAEAGRYWIQAATDLENGASTDGGDTSGYAAAAHELRELTALPDADQTPAQNTTYHSDIDALNTFFATPGLYS